MKTKNLKDYLNKNKKKVKVVEDNRARESICKTIEGIVFSDEIPSSDIMSSDLMTEVDFTVKKLKSSIETRPIENLEDKVIKDKPIEIISKPIEIKPKDTKSIPISKPIEIKPSLPIESSPSHVDSRINKIKQFTNLNLNLDLNKLDTYLILPKPLLRLLKIFKSLLTIQNYNSIRKLTSIFIKVKGSIERTLRTRIEESDIKKIYYLLGDKIEIKSLKIEDKGEMVKTFTFKIKCTGEEMEKRMLRWYVEEKEREVPCREWEDDGEVEGKEDVSVKVGEGSKVEGNREVEDGSKGDFKESDREINGNNLASLNNPINPDLTSPLSNPDLTSSLTNPTPLTNPNLIIQSALNKTNSILQRIKEKELKRKQDFMVRG